jgi:hypothetical protein
MELERIAPERLVSKGVITENLPAFSEEAHPVLASRAGHASVGTVLSFAMKWVARSATTIVNVPNAGSIVSFARKWEQRHSKRGENEERV